MKALPQNLSEYDFKEYVGSVVNYYGGLFWWKHDSPWIKHLTSQSTNYSAIVEVSADLSASSV